MSKKFHAENRKTGERWKPNKYYEAHFLVMYDSGYLAEIREDKYHMYMNALDTKKWAKVMHNKEEL